MAEQQSTDSCGFSKGKVYGVLRAHVTADNGEDHSHKTDMSHYNLITSDIEQTQINEQYQINIDIQSLHSANVKIFSIDPFNNGSIPFSTIPNGFTPLLTNINDPLALDLVRRPLFDLKLLIDSSPIDADQIASKLDVYFKENKPNVIVFGTKYDDQHFQQSNHYGKQRAQTEKK